MNAAPGPDDESPRTDDEAPRPADADTRDWTVVIDAGCSQCGYVPHDPVTTGERLRADVPRWQAVLARGDVAERPSEGVWSPLEYACHSRDLIRVLGVRVASMLEHDEPEFVDYDGEAEAVRGRFWAERPANVDREIAESTALTAAVIDRVAADQWQRTGRRSDGRVFTVADLCRYLLHDVEHHLHDVDG